MADRSVVQSGRYKAYPEYKDSGVEWLGDIPSGWKVNRHKYIARFNKGRNPKEVFDDYAEGYYPYLSMDSLRGHSNSKYAPLTDGLYLVHNDQPLLIWDGSNAGEFVYGKKGILSSTMAAASLISLIDSQYYWYVCKCIEPEMRKHATGMGIPHVNGDELKNISLVLPPLQDQQKIAAFLDYETAKIDTLIQKQQRLIELLTEKRQAMISQAVTKGLNPNAPMKDSGIDWLGEIPEHWDVSLLKYKCDEITDGAHVSPDTENGKHFFISITDIKDGVINFNNALLTSSSSYKYLIKTGCMPFVGDILFSKDGTIGQTAITPKSPKFVVASSLIIIRPDKEKVASGYLELLLQSSLIKEQVEGFVKGAALRRLSIQNLLKVFGVFPPTIKEQLEIEDYVRRNLNNYKNLIDKAEQAIQLMQERRTALISAAVTGKIDVRDWVKPE